MMTPTEKYRYITYTSKGFSSWELYCAWKQEQQIHKIKAKKFRPCRARRTMAAIAANAENTPLEVGLEYDFINKVALDFIMS